MNFLAGKWAAKSTACGWLDSIVLSEDKAKTVKSAGEASAVFWTS